MPINPISPKSVRGSLQTNETAPVPPRVNPDQEGAPRGGWTPRAATPRRRPAETVESMTQTDMNLAAGERRAASQARLDTLETATRNRLSPTSVTKGRGLASDEQDAFKAYANAAADFVGSAARGGSLEPHLTATTLTTLMDQRGDMLEATGQEGVMAFGSTAGQGLSAQGDLNQDAGMTLTSARAELSSVSKRLALRLSGSPRAAILAESNARFEDYVSAATKRAGARVAGGSMEPLARAGMEEHLVRERTALLTKDLARLDL